MVKVALNELIENVHVSPTAPAWFYTLVEDVVNRYGFKFKVRQSDMADKPIF
jgi:hypothetical protein